MNGSSQSIHITLIAFVSRKLLPQQGQIYFLVQLGFFGLAIVVPFPDFPPDTPILKDEPLTISISSKPLLMQKSSVSSVGLVIVHPYLLCF